ncbi:iron-containing alcohol dehydrogenase [Peptoniphilus indolicus]|uniref:NADH-dependent butanol dehydrogenase A n=2 Tax=Peptoniphilus indolicus TaxID=33030 RepID=G4D338_9FIRM|nr:iron-containing alcohol dehydrogenase [Peptoniphilus indolicus]EGY80069.1 NADH-dependent butanol dehydrogenase A [Peptoniphilus indolicus ATCC 29427]SUB75103.1 NADH-dependent butanol dehydrogenase A [Peptoniphilus indolicus]
MEDFIFYNPTKILFGREQLNNLAKEIKKYGSKVLLAYGGGSIKKNGIYDNVVRVLREEDIEFFELSGIEPNPRVDSAREGAKIIKENGIDFVLAVGGGSVVDCSKLIVAAAKTDADAWDIVIKKHKVREALPLGVVLTLSATGSEMDAGSVITNLETREKLDWGSALVRPKFSILNPEHTYSVNKWHTAAGVADIMSHTMENYFTTYDDCYLQDSFAEGILKTCVKYAKDAIEDPQNYEARANLMWSNTWAINGLLESGKDTDWSVHAMEHELSAYYDITHGVGLAILTPRWLEHVLNENTKSKVARFAKEVFAIDGEDEMEVAKKGITALHDFFVGLGIPMTLREVGIDDEHLKEMAENTIKHVGGPIDGFQQLNVEDVLEIYKKSL